MQLIVNIKDNSIAEKILWFLTSFSNKGVVVKQVDTDATQENLLTDEYIEENWRELLMGIKSDPEYYKSEQYKLDRGEYLMEKYK
ncbi:MAG: hypothetical protein M0Q24_04880 [Sulfurimonas sp.]|uniref:hypothetical protein n=1 Tax=Sulfurimonas sp. TaxID=2022749 RepID=UPI0025F0A2C7|nr:hypothetical protein [Sulfurimonas sp.]MCK9491404.1 hypothetical protein [Sulfurimonas sp.]